MNLKHVFIGLVCSLSAPAQAAPVETDHVRAELIAERTALVAGAAPNWLGLRLTPEAGWHVYWQNPGDSGLPTKLSWTLPPDISAGAIVWPYPHAEKLGDLTNYGYSEDTLHLVPLTVASVAGAVELKAEAKWLVCKDICIPGSAVLSLTLPIAMKATPDVRWSALFAQTRAQIPQAASQWTSAFSTEQGDFSLLIENARFAGDAQFEFFPLANDLVSHAAAQRIVVTDQGLRLSQKLSNYFTRAPETVEGVLVVRQGTDTLAYQVQAQPGVVAAVAAAAVVTEPPAQTTTSLAGILFFALLGGLILNLMPCVFPVLSLKAISVMRAREHQAAYQRRHALAYTAGVILSCTGVALLLLALRAGGAAIGWGFQLQSPVFVAALAYLIFALGLSLSGVFEFGTRWMGAGQSLTEQGGLAGSFFTGVLATVVASPCTAPFMGVALGYALTQPVALSLLIFATLGLGLALPFLLLGFFPRLAGFLPRPGAWMETFKQAMAFPLYLTVVWLTWVIARQTSANAAALIMMGLVLIAFALWLWRREGLRVKLLQGAALAAAVLLLASPLLEPTDARPRTTQEGKNEVYSAERLTALRTQQRTVFVNFTADWCITCKLNERTALASDRVLDAFKQQNVAWLTGDWTRSDPAITQVLEQFGRSGVPLYLVYVKGGEPIVLPQVLTPNIILNALE